MSSSTTPPPPLSSTTSSTTSPPLHVPTKSIEQTLLPLIRQISTLVSHRSERSTLSSCGGGRAVARVGQAVNLAVERFVTVGETIADDNADIKQDMYDACKEARAAGASIERLCMTASAGAGGLCPVSGGSDGGERGAMVRAARGLLASVTRVLLLADIVVVKQLLLAKDKVTRSLGRLESVTNFTEFVKAFSVFGAEMVELAHVTGERQNDLKDERRRAQMAAARQVLERSTMMLLTSSKACLRHPDCPTARENRDTVFCQMRRAMDLIHFVVKDGVLDCQAALSPRTQGWDCEEGLNVGGGTSSGSERGTVCGALRRLGQLVSRARATHAGPSTREALAKALDQLIERTQDFTDSAYTSHNYRQNIILLSDKTKLELNQLLRVAVNMDDAIHEEMDYGSDMENELEVAAAGALEAARSLWVGLVGCAREQASELSSAAAAAGSAARALSQPLSPARLNTHADALLEHIDHILEVCKLLRHIALSETLQVTAKFTEINLRIYGPQVVTAAKTLSLFPASKIAKENLEVFADMWQWLLSDVTAVAKEILEMAQGKPEKQVYMSLPRPGKHGTTSKPLKAVRLDSEEQAKIAKSGLEMKMMSSEMDAETDKWQESGSALEENNDIVKRAKNMSSMAFAMYQFTKGEGQLNTTQDLFTQAEYFAEEANRLYKVVRQFSYQVPAGTSKKLLLEGLDKVPTYVQQLQFTVKDPTVGRAATFSKVDNVIQETKNLMNVISKVVTTCFDCASKYKLDFSGLSGRTGGGSGSGREDEGSGGVGGDSKAGGSGPDTSM